VTCAAIDNNLDRKWNEDDWTASDDRVRGGKSQVSHHSSGTGQRSPGPSPISRKPATKVDSMESSISRFLVVLDLPASVRQARIASGTSPNMTACRSGLTRQTVGNDHDPGKVTKADLSRQKIHVDTER